LTGPQIKEKTVSLHKSPLAAAISSLSVATGGMAVTIQPVVPVLQKVLDQANVQLSLLNFWNYVIILVAVVIEGPIATLLGGVWASTGRVNFWAVILISAVANLVADSFWYYIGHVGREPMIHRWGRYLRINMEAINKMEKVLFGENATKVLFTAKVTSALVIPALIAAGILQIGWRKVMKAIILAQLTWSLTLTAIGYWMADSYVALSHKIENFGWILGVISLVLVVGYLVYRWWKVNQEMVY
jgi:membrane protein DedA with SNARE-associated domain